MLTAYISYARTHINPELTAAASDALVAAYVAMRSAGIDARGGSERRITATTRQLESMIRLSEAHARMRFSDRVEHKDVEEASRLIREALKESATDPVTGLYVDQTNAHMQNADHSVAASISTCSIPVTGCNNARCTVIFEEKYLLYLSVLGQTKVSGTLKSPRRSTSSPLFLLRRLSCPASSR